ncbi:xanthine dehydrogenase family protein molybdopterin-binding subunit [Mycobacterium sp. NAZ190054]|uniref:xanthine dehydrogenase family protein molybdopterin-binding subunit n=1 Tax=Mycobacterium sp. NAZ190054 TaxID=1747766 RepID=UPI0007957BDF|nr:xanthine dehydrogenase family protein molybdopterin-binding subunit [Mycobacterium sp. NAZ190054]KWX68270.1 xanthine dehydrogenase [Mycobacterium sp. NAZ190054]
MSARQAGGSTGNGTWVGASVPRREDPRLLTGRGRYVDDIAVPGMLHAQFVRSTEAHARLRSVDLSEVRHVPGVVAAFTADDLGLADLVGRLNRPESEFRTTPMPVLARDVVRFVGEPIAIVVATDPYAAEDGLEAAVVDYDLLPPVMTEQAALAAGAPLLHAGAPDNTFVDVTMFATDGIDEIFARAHTVVEIEHRSGRQNALPMETRGVVAEWVDRDEQLLIRASTQIPHMLRDSFANSAGIDQRHVRVVTPDIGGGFGQKAAVGREELAAAAAALRLRRPVKWIEDRRDNLTAAFLAREQHFKTRGAFDENGRLLALDNDVVCDMGAYSVFPFTAAIEPMMAATELPGVYVVPAYRIRSRAIATNKAPTAAYRGVSRPQCVTVMELLMERAARTLGVDALDLRRRNLITVFPYRGVNNITYDPGSYLESLNLCEQTLRDEGWYDRKREAAAQGRILGIGYACYSERTGLASGAFSERKPRALISFDLSDITMDTSGSVRVTTGTLSHGQSHETTMAQIVADRLGLPMDKVKVVQGDTEKITYGFGSFASRSITIGGSAVAIAAVKLADQLCALAAHLMEVDVTSVELDGDGGVRVRNHPDKRMSFADLAFVAYLQSTKLPKDIGPGLRASASFDLAAEGVFSNATHGVVVEIDSGTGDVAILRYICVEDVGVAINPQVVEGQARGGIAQGIASTLFEQVTYDANGQPLCPTFMEYKVPTAMEIPDIRIEHLETPSALTETGAKGAGEGGTIGVPGAVLNAVNDALRHTGVELDSTPIPRELVYRALENPLCSPLEAMASDHPRGLDG